MSPAEKHRAWRQRRLMARAAVHIVEGWLVALLLVVVGRALGEWL